MCVYSGMHSDYICLVVWIPSKPICFHAVPRCSPFGCQWGSVVLNRILLGRISERVYYRQITYRHSSIQQKTTWNQQNTTQIQQKPRCPTVPIRHTRQTSWQYHRATPAPSLYKTTHLHPTEPTWHRQNPTHEHNRTASAHHANRTTTSVPCCNRNNNI